LTEPSQHGNFALARSPQRTCSAALDRVMGDTTLPAQPKPVQDRPLGQNLHKDLRSYPRRGRKSSEIQEVTVSREALKIRCGATRVGVRMYVLAVARLARCPRPV